MALLEGFLVRLGFEVDQDSAAKMKDTARKSGEAVADIGKKAVSTGQALFGIGRKAVAMGVALGAAVLKASSDLSKMYMTAARSGTSITNIRAMGYSLSQVGGDSEQAMQSIETLRTRFRDLPGLASGFSSAFNVDAIDRKTGKMRDMVDIVTDLGKQWRNLSSAAVSQQASFLGIDPTTAELIRSGEFERFYAQGKEMQKQMGVDLDESAKRTAQFMSDINAIWETFKVGSIDMLTSAVGDWMHGFAQELPGLFKEFRAEVGKFFNTLFGEGNFLVNAYKAITGLFDDDKEKEEPRKEEPRLEAEKKFVTDSSVNPGDDFSGLTDNNETPESTGLEAGDDYGGAYVSKSKRRSAVKETRNEFGSKGYQTVRLTGRGEAKPFDYPGFTQQAASSPTYVESPAQVVTTAAKESSPTSVTNDNRQTVDNSQSSQSSSVQVNQSIVINGAGYSSADAIQQAAYDGTQSAIRDSASVIR